MGPDRVAHSVSASLTPVTFGSLQAHCGRRNDRCCPAYRLSFTFRLIFRCSNPRAVVWPRPDLHVLVG